MAEAPLIAAAARRLRFSLGIGVVSAIVGVLVALHYHRLGLTLSHYDARGHLVVARRIFDSLTPGWQQVGAVWLPLPHLLNALPVQIDAFYRTGASGVAISVVSFALCASAVSWLILGITESPWAAAAGAALVVLNPNVLYLQATPMTEPLLLGLTTCAVALLVDWSRGVASRTGQGMLTGVVFALACLTRYEAWVVTACALTIAVWVRWRGGAGWAGAMREVLTIGRFPIAAILLFVVFSRIVVGEWFTSSGFFVPENVARHHPIASVSEVVWGVRRLSGYAETGAAVIGAAWLLVHACLDRRRAGDAIALALFASAALPWFAFLEGHPYRIRYMVPLLVGEAVVAGLLVAEIGRRSRALGTIALGSLMILAVFEQPPLGAGAAMVVEAQWDRPNVAVRQQLTNCLRDGYRGETIMASMGSLGHYMQELAAAGFPVREFLHEGNGDIWLRALERPHPFVGWMLIEEQAEGGDMLARRARENPHFLDGFSRVCSGAGVALYQRQNLMLNVAR